MLAIVQIWDAQNQEVTRSVGATSRRIVSKIAKVLHDGKTFRCAKHGEFQVSDSVLNVPALMDADTSQWETALKNAAWRADPGLRPRILSYDF